MQFYCISAVKLIKFIYIYIYFIIVLLMNEKNLNEILQKQ